MVPGELIAQPTALVLYGGAQSSKWLRNEKLHDMVTIRFRGVRSGVNSRIYLVKTLVCMMG